MELFLNYASRSKSLSRKVEWVKSHQDDDSPWNTIEELQSLKLLLNAKLNIWCDKMAGEACKQNVSQLEANVLPTEKWAVYCVSSTPKKIGTHFNSAILTQLYHDNLTTYVWKKHGVCESKFDSINTKGLQTTLSKLKPLQRATCPN